jgi:hypothetical protein
LKSIEKYVRYIHTPFSQQLTVQENVHGFGFFSKVGNSNTRTTNDLTGVTFTVNLTETSPLTKLLGVRDFDQVDVVFSTESFNQLEVFGFGT